MSFGGQNDKRQAPFVPCEAEGGHSEGIRHMSRLLPLAPPSPTGRSASKRRRTLSDDLTRRRLPLSDDDIRCLVYSYG
ncbi:hypothetical protein NHX12_008915 [Muraenolepis orangiensis]|uniref:Uncharacterized protein n=1 Tax=Muraenolepis orangiensis TaxID=630683 RepID=A0A9Q0I8H8_9TELE|nr:hypothetical protein NHX12_008915 [Muraenolepis orangiensis]